MMDPPNTGAYEPSVIIFREPDKKRFIDANYDSLTRTLATSLLTSDYNHQLFIEWTYCPSHPLIFDIDVLNPQRVHTLPLLLHYFHHQFLPTLRRYYPFTTLDILLAMRRQQTSGMHIHLLHVQLSHDDYVHLCELMKPECHDQVSDCVVTLDCPSTMCLVASDKPKGQGGLYVPTHLFRVEGHHTVVHTFQGKALMEMVCQMMPLPKQHALTVAFRTRIAAQASDGVAHFTSCVNQQDYVLCKDHRLEPRPIAFSLAFFQQQARFLKPFQAPQNRVLRTWYKTFSACRNGQGIFSSIEERLLRQCPHFQDGRPLSHLLASPDLCLPVYYTLCHLLQPRYNPETVAERLRRLVPDFPTRVKTPPVESSRFTWHTMVYCAFKVAPRDAFGGRLGMGWDWILEATETVAEMQQHVRWIQKQFFPIAKASKQLYSWDPMLDQWTELQDPQHIRFVLQFIHRCMMHFEGYEKLPMAIRTQSDWIDALVGTIWDELQDSETIAFRPSTALADGINVPEYYFCPTTLEKRLEGLTLD